ncbi:hypothetical protein Q1695_013580 [Nippostrongylus brasiliensis]|nr:hypothetical protein Q1695_013580 [Nippostrongylus brasiliensis]
MSDSDSSEYAEGGAWKKDELVENKFVFHSGRSEISALAEGFFVVVFAIFGLFELVLLEERVCGLCLLCGAFIFLCLFIEFYFGVVYNCWPLLVCHAAQAGALSISIFILLLCTMALSHPNYITVIPFRITMIITVVVSMILMILLATFAASSLCRARELWAFDACRADHLRRLLIDALETLDRYKEDDNEPKKR